MTAAPPTASLLQSYAGIRRRLLADLGSLTRWIAAEQKAGRPVSRARLLRQQRYRDLLTQTAVQMDVLAKQIEAKVITEATAAADKARIDAVAAIQKALGPGPAGVSMSFNTLPVGAVNDITARLAQGEPLRNLLDSFGAEAAERAREALITGIGIGANPRQTAALLRKALDISAVRAMAIVRQEQLGAFRRSSLATYSANQSVVKAWRWRCARQTRTCALCWAMDGQEFPLDEPFASHVACRCTTQPVTKSWSELGFTDIPDRPDPEPGHAVFARLSEVDQRKVLGPGKLAAYKSGTPLSAFVQKTNSSVWGPGRRVRPLREVKRG